MHASVTRSPAMGRVTPGLAVPGRDRHGSSTRQRPPRAPHASAARAAAIQHRWRHTTHGDSIPGHYRTRAGITTVKARVIPLTAESRRAHSVSTAERTLPDSGTRDRVVPALSSLSSAPEDRFQRWPDQMNEFKCMARTRGFRQRLVRMRGR